MSGLCLFFWLPVLSFFTWLCFFPSLVFLCQLIQFICVLLISYVCHLCPIHCSSFVLVFSPCVFLQLWLVLINVCVHVFSWCSQVYLSQHFHMRHCESSFYTTFHNSVSHIYIVLQKICLIVNIIPLFILTLFYLASLNLYSKICF